MAEERKQNKPANNIESLKDESVSASETGNGRMTFDYFTGLLEAGIFIAEEPITLDQLSRLSGEKPSKAKEKIDLLMEHYRQFPRGIRLVETAGGYRFETDPAYAPALKKYYRTREITKLTKAAMEALSIIAYKQPVTVPEISEIRSVDSSGVIQNLLGKKLIRILGRKNVVGKPLLYGTTKQFLIRFGLNSLQDLPDFDEFLLLTGTEVEPGKLRQEFEEHFSGNTNRQFDDGGSAENEET